MYSSVVWELPGCDYIFIYILLNIEKVWKDINKNSENKELKILNKKRSDREI